jgi:DNA-binding response OmpR family regulator
MPNKKILIIEDNQDMAQLLAIHLREQKYEIELCFNGNDGLAKAMKSAYDMIILDLMLPGINGLELCKKLRTCENYVPVLMLTAKSSELDRVSGLEIGADDYVTKPFSISEVLARIKAIFRRMEFDSLRQPDNNYAILRRGDLEINLQKYTVAMNQATIELTAKEFDLLAFFMQHPGIVFTRAQILDQVWGFGYDGYEHTVNSHINRLRIKIEDDPGNPVYILTVWGVGYKFSENV